MREARIIPFEQSIQPHVRVREHIAGNRDAFTSEARGGQRDEQALHGLLAPRKRGQPGVHDLTAGKSEGLEAISSKSGPDPATGACVPCHAATRRRAHAGRARAAAIAPVPAELLAD